MTTKKYTNQLGNKKRKDIIKDFFQVTKQNEVHNNKNVQQQQIKSLSKT